jgi:hypothetical protein
MRRAVMLLAGLMAGLGAASAQEWDVPSGPNLGTNPGFEQGAEGWNLPEGTYRVEDGTGRDGSRCLRFDNDDPELYRLCSQSVPVEPGAQYEISAWVRSQSIEGRDSGATICLEWQKADGSWMGGHYPSGVRGDSDWTEIRSRTGRIPAEAAGAHITCYVRQGMTGTAWWDDVSVRRVRARPLHVLLTSPNYRGLMLEPGPQTVAFRCRLNLRDAGVEAADAQLDYVLTAVPSNEAVAAGSEADVRSGDTFVSLDVPDLAEGEYSLQVSLARKGGGEPVITETRRLVRTNDRPSSYVDAHNRLIIDGEPFLPLGMYWSGVNEEQLRIYADSPFNCLMPYQQPDRATLDLAGGLGLKVICSIKDFYYGTRWCPRFIESEADERPQVSRVVRQFRDHPAVLAWYINDELPLTLLPRLEAHRQWVEEEDPDHPSWVVLYQVGDVADYARTFDVIGTDPYPIPQNPISMAGEWARLTREAVADSRALWMVPQCFAKSVYGDRESDRARAPTYEELRSMTWQCITEGADGVIFYSWFDIRRDANRSFEEAWGDVKRVAAEVKEMTPVLLSAEPVPNITVAAPDSVHWTARRVGGRLYLFFVNAGPEAAAGQASVGGGARQVTPFELAPYDVQIKQVGL